MDDFRTEVDEHGNIKVTSYVEAVVISKEEQEQALRIFKQLQEENDKLREQVTQLRDNWEAERDYADQMEAKEKRAVSENVKLRESVRNLLTCVKHEECEESCPNYEPVYTDYGYEKNGSTVVESEYLGCCTVGLENCNSMFFDTDEYLRELGIEVDDDN